MSTSVPETILADLTALMGTIQTPTYRNNVKKVSQDLKELSQVTEFPEIVVVLNEGSVESNEPMTIFKEFVDVACIGYVQGDPSDNTGGASSLVAAGESLLHDMRKALAGSALTHVNDSTKRYKLYRKTPVMRFIRLLPIPGTRAGIVGVQFTIWIIAQDYTFAI